MVEHPDSPPRDSSRRVAVGGVIVCAVAAAFVLTALSTHAWPVLVLDGMYSLAIVLAALGWGVWAVVALGRSRRPVLQQLCLAAALGLGALSTAGLVLGVLGWLNVVTAWGLVGGGVVAGIVRLYLAQDSQDPLRPKNAEPVERGKYPVLLTYTVAVVLGVPLGFATFCATLPPGVLWTDEARGYDVLEYHLQAPREYYEAGRIHFLPHNVYAQFPQQMETLYLLAMHLAGDPYEAAVPSQLLHLLCGVLAVIAVGAWTPAGRSRLVAVLVVGTVPWLVYLGALAYVELGMLLFAAVAAGLLMQSVREAGRVDWRTALAAGLCAGLAGGCKYTALVFVAGAFVVTWLVAMRGGLGDRVRAAGVFVFGTLLAFSPWLIRNAAFTGNPVYPFAYSWFGGRAWSDEQDTQWQRGHQLPAADATAAGRTRVTARELLGLRRDDHANGTTKWRLERTLFSPLLLILAGIGLLRARSRSGWMLAGWAVLILVAWAGLTHMPGRFAVPLVIPLGLLAGHAISRRTDNRSDAARAADVGTQSCALLAAASGVLTLTMLLYSEAARWPQLGLMPGSTDAFIMADELYGVPDDGYVWMVGRANVYYARPRLHYTVVFNRDPWLEFAAEHPDDPGAAVNWLRERGVTHVSFAWSEIARLTRTYGFAKIVTLQWVRRLTESGLEFVRPTTLPDGTVIGELYRVVPLDPEPPDG